MPYQFFVFNIQFSRVHQINLLGPVFVTQITNQMITACKSYITIQGSETIWTQETDEVIRKLKDCLRLNEDYQRHFHKTKQKLEDMPNERKFEFSEMYIFGKFDTFARRLRKIIDMFETMEMYSHLQESKVEGE